MVSNLELFGLCSVYGVLNRTYFEHCICFHA